MTTKIYLFGSAYISAREERNIVSIVARRRNATDSDVIFIPHTSWRRDETDMSKDNTRIIPDLIKDQIEAYMKIHNFTPDEIKAGTEKINIHYCTDLETGDNRHVYEVFPYDGESYTKMYEAPVIIDKKTLTAPLRMYGIVCGVLILLLAVITFMSFLQIDLTEDMLENKAESKVYVQILSLAAVGAAFISFGILKKGAVLVAVAGVVYSIIDYAYYSLIDVYSLISGGDVEINRFMPAVVITILWIGAVLARYYVNKKIDEYQN